MNDTIAAVATAPGEGAVSVIRISGADAFSIAEAVSDRSLHDAEGYTIRVGNIIENGKPVDQVLFSIFHAPKSYTGEDVVEISCHGGIYITRKILSLVLGSGARLAERGEFTQRAFLNGKMDLSQAEGVNDLIRARDEVNAVSAVHSLKGSVQRILDPLTESLTQIIAQIEVNIDYPEYDDVEQLRDEQILPQAEEWLKMIRGVIEKAQQSVLIRNGVDTVILGRPNVGKSSLLNALLEEDKAIVTDIAGTTRDLVEGSVRVGNVTLNLIDTAGIRASEDVIEQIGIEKSLKALEKAQLVIVVLDSSSGMTEEDRELLELTKDRERIVVYNKKDEKEIPGTMAISAVNKDIHALTDEIEKRYENGIRAAFEDTLNNERQIGLAIQAETYMKNAVSSLRSGAEVDLVTIDLQNAWFALREITGEAGREDLLDEIFSRFCLGK
ncbi:MAG: tRNA uridine-5-carboxymethylaminomethyl(34) synthesis GTPase MnmE [Solobacterium sp.]|nr:tRNA uridine-5-carboxymethylaminomethyl(34) synthesis GTPase MnmE [Solobacterium sp.]